MSLESRFWAFRAKGWTEIDAATYQQAWQQFGGSVITHPEVVQKLSALVDIKVNYLAWYEDNVLQAAMPTWGRYLALHKDVLKKNGMKRAFDLGNAEVILPQAENSVITVKHRMASVSSLHQGRINKLKNKGQQLAMAKEPESYSKKFRYNHRREQRLLEEAGGQVLDFAALPSEQQAVIYCDLFQKRWGFEAPGKQRMAQVFEIMRPFMVGHYIVIQDRPAAVQVLYRVESPKWISVEYINGGVDPELNEFSPGSVLTFVNTQAQWEHARQHNKALRYSFGLVDREYKDRWCNNVPVFEV